MKTKGTLMLLLAALIWGMAFVAQSLAANNIGPFTFNAARSLVAALFLFVLIEVRKAFKKTLPEKPEKTDSREVIIGGLLCGVALFSAVNFQQFGISAYPDGAASSGRAGFLTASYVVMVALCARISGKKLHPIVLFSAAGCIAGMYMLCLSGGFSVIYLGDILVLVSAVFFTAYILIIDHFSKLDSVKISFIQFLVCGMLSLIAMLIVEKPAMGVLLAAWLPILYTGILSSGVGYTLQIAGQKYTEPAVASIVMSLESVFAALAGWIILDERLSGGELIGCGLVFLAVILAQVPEFIKKGQTFSR
ncbi:MAG: DMT family transporter [Peptococcaceae bacterium]|nr:DMT family transporter [Peptococcaceae bacterium]